MLACIAQKVRGYRLARGICTKSQCCKLYHNRPKQCQEFFALVFGNIRVFEKMRKLAQIGYAKWRGVVNNSAISHVYRLSASSFHTGFLLFMCCPRREQRRNIAPYFGFRQEQFTRIQRSRDCSGWGAWRLSFWRASISAMRS